ncbi:MAG: hypothetical protein HY584_02285 [Candidatus Omnitrophica bacterium]|nr:hypothetical protein [Candidatus Omnitrophota bacterium]
MKRPKIRNPKSLKGKTILLCVTGSIAAYRSCELVRDLRSEGSHVICLMTEAATKFVTPLTFRSLSGHPVYTDPFSEGEDWNVLHTTLADQASLIVIAPATADIIARLAQGFAGDLVTSVVLASRARVLIVPAMNDHMFAHSITQDNIRKLQKIGYRFIEPIAGDLVCGRVGVGHIAEHEAILDTIQKILHTPHPSPSPFRQKTDESVLRRMGKAKE